MTDETPIPLPRLISMVWGRLMMQQRYQSAAFVALLAHFLSREQSDEELETGSMPLLLKSIDELRGAPDERATSPGAGPMACSFCGRGQPEVRLAAGARAFICDSCVSTLNETFSANPS